MQEPTITTVVGGLSDTGKPLPRFNDPRLAELVAADAAADARIAAAKERCAAADERVKQMETNRPKSTITFRDQQRAIEGHTRPFWK